MHINCPSCDIAYDVPESKLRGRQLRCAGCGHSWCPLPAEPPPPPPPSPESEPESKPESPPPPQPSPAPTTAPSFSAPPEIASAFTAPSRPTLSRPRRKAPSMLTSLLILGWIGTGLVCGLGGWAGYHHRTTVMHAWPPSIRLYRALGLGG